MLFSPFGLVIFDVGPRADGFTMDFSLMLGEKIFGRLAMCFVDVGWATSPFVVLQRRDLLPQENHRKPLQKSLESLQFLLLGVFRFLFSDFATKSLNLLAFLFLLGVFRFLFSDFATKSLNLLEFLSPLGRFQILVLGFCYKKSESAWIFVSSWAFSDSCSRILPQKVWICLNFCLLLGVFKILVLGFCYKKSESAWIFVSSWAFSDSCSRILIQKVWICLNFCLLLGVFRFLFSDFATKSLNLLEFLSPLGVFRFLFSDFATKSLNLLAFLSPLGRFQILVLGFCYKKSESACIFVSSWAFSDSCSRILPQKVWICLNFCLLLGVFRFLFSDFATKSLNLLAFLSIVGRFQILVLGFCYKKSESAWIFVGLSLLLQWT